MAEAVTDAPTETETVSQKRGRPRILSEHEERFFRMLWQPQSRRQLMNRYYSQGAISALRDERGEISDEFSWLIDMTAGRVRFTVLTELGRLYDLSLIRSLAQTICAHKMTARHAVAYVRGHRLGAQRPEPSHLADGLIAYVNDYQKRFPETTCGDVADAVRILWNAVQDAQRAEVERENEGEGAEAWP